MKKILTALLLAALATTFVVAGSNITIKGSDTLVRLGQRWAEEYMKVKEGAVITLRESSRKNEAIRVCLDTAAGRGVPSWLELDSQAFTGTVKQLPTREEITMPIQEQLIVELYSK